jgi:hypothetical protein
MSATDTKKPDGGAAFARPYNQSGHTFSSGQEGMSLRDWFAGQALPSLISATINEALKALEGKDPKEYIGHISIMAYQFSDAMIAEREK